MAFERKLWPSYALVDYGIHSMDSEMRHVLEHCLRTFPTTQGGRIATVKADFKAWKKRNDIEADIVRLKERVQACHLRFTVFPLYFFVQLTSR